MIKAVVALAALAQEHRLGAFRFLVERGRPGAAAGEVAAALDMPASSLSFHLAHLTRAGMIHQRRIGRSLNYSVDYAAMRELMDYLTENCCGGADCDPAAVREEAA